MAGWIVFGALMLTFLILLLLPVVIRVEYQGDWRVLVQYLFLRFPVYPSQKEKKVKPKKKKPSGEPEEGEKEKKKKKQGRSLTDTVEMALDLVSSATGGLRMLFRNLRVSSLRLWLRVGREDAAETGIQYGNCCAYLYSAYALLQHYIRIRRVSLDLQPDFLAEEDRWELSLRARLTPLAVLGAVLYMGASFLHRQMGRKGEGPAGGQDKSSKRTGAAASGEVKEVS